MEKKKKSNSSKIRTKKNQAVDMKNEKKVTTRKIILICLLLVVVFLIFLIVKGVKDSCSLVDTDYEIIMKTVNNDDLGSVLVCVDCDENSYSELPTLELEGYIFSGWYYDKELTKKIDVGVLDIEPVYKKNIWGCHVGYEDIVIYAKLDKE